jgi:hypothetical protein
MKRVRAFLSPVLAGLLALPFYLQTACAQPADDAFARLAGVKEWQVELELVYDNEHQGGDTHWTEHTTSQWTGVLHQDESFWQDDPPLQLLRWYGDMNVNVDGTVRIDSRECHSTITAHGPDRYSFAISVRRDGYQFDQGYCGTDFGEQVTVCPSGTTKSRSGVQYSPQSWRIVRPLPAQGTDISDSAELDESSPNQVEGEELRPGQKLKVTWKFSPVQSYVCGPDVTPAMIRTYVQMIMFFAGLDAKDKLASCRALHGDPLLRAKDAWDIKDLYWGNASWLDSYTRLGTCDIPGDGVTSENEPASTCKHSVRYATKCVLAGTLNYFAYGWMHRLCYDYALTTRDLRNDQLSCVTRLGGCQHPGGIPSKAAIGRYNDSCRTETGYSGDDVVPTPAECASPPEKLDPDDWDMVNMDKYIMAYKGAVAVFTLDPSVLGDIEVPIAFANAAFQSRHMAVPPVENRAQCKERCKNVVKEPFTWVWEPRHPRIPAPDR